MDVQGVLHVHCIHVYWLSPGMLLLYLKYSRLPLSRIPRDSLKHFEISVLRHTRVERVRKTIN